MLLSRKELVIRVRDEYPAKHDLYLLFGECLVQVLANHPDIIASLVNYCQPFVVTGGNPDIVISFHETPETDFGLHLIMKEPDPGKSKVKEEYADFLDGRAVRKRLTGMVFFFGGGQHLAMGPCLANMNQVVNFINNRYIEWMLCRGCLLGHAAGVERHGKGLALAGFSGTGKSTLSLHIMSRGTRFVSNDRLIIQQTERGLRMNGVAKLPRINPGTVLNNPDLSSVISEEERETFKEIPADLLWHVEQKYDVPIDECFGTDKFVLSAVMEDLVILNWRREPIPLVVRRVDPFERKDLLPAFIKTPGLFIHTGKDSTLAETSEDNYAQWLSQCRVWEFSGGVDFESATRACLNILDGDLA